MRLTGIAAALLLPTFLTVLSCKDQPATQTAPSATPTSSAIPEDLVGNGFFSNPSDKLAVKFDGSVASGETIASEGDQGPKNKILDPGAEPRAQLMYNLVAGKTVTITTTIASEVSGPDIPEGAGKQPPVKFTVNFTIKKKDGQKTPVDFKIAKIEITGAPSSAEKQLAALQTAMTKVSGTVNVSPMGAVSDLALKGAEELQRGGGEQVLAMLERALELVVVPLPAGQVGVGARWQVSSSVPEEGTTLDSTFTWLAKNEQGYDIKVESKRAVGVRTLNDRSGKKITLEVKGSSSYTLTTMLDGPTSKATGESKTDVITQAQDEQKHVNNEKTSITIEKLETPKK